MTQRSEGPRVTRNVIISLLSTQSSYLLPGMLPSIFTFSSLDKPATLADLFEYRTACALGLGLDCLSGEINMASYLPSSLFPSLHLPYLLKGYNYGVVPPCLVINGTPLCDPHPTSEEKIFFTLDEHP